MASVMQDFSAEKHQLDLSFQVIDSLDVQKILPVKKKNNKNMMNKKKLISWMLAELGEKKNPQRP